MGGAKVLLDEVKASWGEIGQGLVISLSFAKHATENHVHSAVRFLLTAKLSTAATREAGTNGGRQRGGSIAESVIDLCKRGCEQGVLLLPQATLISGLAESDMGLLYDDQCEE